MNPVQTIAARAQILENRGALPPNPRVTALVQQAIAVPTPGVRPAILQATTARVVQLQRQVVNLEELNGRQRVELHARIFRAATANRDLTQRLQASEALVQDRNQVIQDLERDLRRARTELRNLQEQNDHQTDRLEVGGNRQRDLERRIQMLEGRINRIEQELLEARTKLLQQQELFREYVNLIAVKKNGDDKMRNILIAAFGTGFGTSILSLPIGIISTYVIMFGGLIEINYGEEGQRKKAITDRIDELMAQLDLKT